MSNPNDPKPNSQNPDKPDPTDADAAKKKAEEASGPSSKSSYEFQLPGVKSYSDLPDLPLPETGETPYLGALPPSPATRRHSGGSFEFNLDDFAAGSDPNVQVPPAPTPADPGASVRVPTPNVVDLGALDPPSGPPSSFLMSSPEAPAAPVPPSDSAVNLGPAVPTAFTLSSSDLDIGPPPGPLSGVIPEAFAASAPDIHPPSDEPLAMEVPDAFVTSSSDIDLTSTPAPEVPSGVITHSTDFDVPAPPDSLALRIPEAFATSNSDLEIPSEEGTRRTIPEGFAVSSAEIDIGNLPDVPTAEPISGGNSATDIGKLYKTDDQPSSFTLGQAEAPAAPRAPSDPSLSEILPPPEVPGTDPSFGSMGSNPARGSSGSVSVPDISILYGSNYPANAATPPPVDSGAFASGDKALPEMELPPVPGQPDSGVGLGDVKPVAPSSAWLDSDVYKAAPTDPDVPAPAPPAEPVIDDPTENSDIFSGDRSEFADSTEHSDVIIATAFPTGSTEADLPSGSSRPSDIALTFDSPPDGSTMSDSSGSDLPIADEVPGESGILATLRSGDVESIHDLPDPTQGSDDPLFDSARLADAPDLPSKRLTDDAPDYGLSPEQTNDASSILADLTGSSSGVLGGSSSSVRVEAPGVERTLTSSEQPGSAFDLTVPDEPIPEGMFDVPGDDSPSGSNLFDRTSLEVDLDKELSDQGDPAPSSIFSDPRKSPTGSGSEGSIDARARALEPTEPDIDEAEFSARPVLNDTTERPKDAPPAVPVPTTRRPSSGDFQLPADPTDKGAAIDWNNVSDDEGATRGASLSSVMREMTNDATQDAAPVAPGADDVDDEGNPVVTFDYVAESAEVPVAPQKTSPAPKKGKERREPDFTEKPTKPSKVLPGLVDSGPARTLTDSGSAERADPGAAPAKKRESRSLFTGVLLGGLIATAASAGVYFSGAVPNSEKQVVKAPDKTGAGQTDPNKNEPKTAPAAPDAQTALVAGNAAEALKLLKAEPTTTDEKATDGAVRTFARWQTLDKPAPNDPELKKAADSLAAVVADAEGAKTPEGEKRAVLATVRLGVTHTLAGNRAEARKLYTDALTKFPNQKATFEALLAKMDAEEPGGPTSLAPRLTPAEAERILLAVTVLLADDGPKPEDAEEPGVHYWKAVKLASTGKYAEAISLLEKAKAAHVKRAKALAGRGLNPLTDPLEEMFPRACDEMIAGWKLRDEMYRHPATADAMKKNTLPKALDGFAQAGKDLADAKAAAAKFQKEATDAKGDVAKWETEAKNAKADAAKFQKEATTAKGDAEKFAKDAEKADKAAKESDKAKGEAEAALKLAQADVKTKNDLLTAIATELKPTKVLPEKWEQKDLVTGVKTVAGLATGTDAQAVVRAKKEAEEAKQLLTTEMKKHEGEIAKLKKTNTDEITKVAEKFTAEAKKQDEAHKIALKEEQAKTAAEKKMAADQAITFQKQLTNAITPAQAVDIWLPVLTDLRRPADADAARIIATRSQESSARGSEEEAKAITTIGMALLIKSDLAGAKAQFQAARNSPAYKANAGKYWTKVADTGLEAIDDPLALYRQPVVIPPIDVRAATKSLDAGILAYKAGRYDAAALALADAAKNDPTDPVAWYYLGAARWAKGEEDQARKDFDQGAEREKMSSVTSREVSAALAAIQGHARAALDKARP